MVCMFCRMSYSRIILAVSSNSSGVNLGLTLRKSTSYSFSIGIRWMCAWGTSRPKTTTPLFCKRFSPGFFSPPFWRRRSSLAGFRRPGRKYNRSLSWGRPAYDLSRGDWCRGMPENFHPPPLVAWDFAVDDASEYGCHMKICLLIASLLVVAYRLFEVP